MMAGTRPPFFSKSSCSLICFLTICFLLAGYHSACRGVAAILFTKPRCTHVASAHLYSVPSQFGFQLGDQNLTIVEDRSRQCGINVGLLEHIDEMLHIAR